MNAVVMIGRLVADPELRYTGSGKAVATMNIAVDRAFKGHDGQKQTDFFAVVAWGKIAENCANYLSKGRLVGIRGSIQNRSYDAQDGSKRYVTEIIADEVQFLERAQSAAPEAAAFSAKTPGDAGYTELKDDDVPF